MRTNTYCSLLTVRPLLGWDTGILHQVRPSLPAGIMWCVLLMLLVVGLPGLAASPTVSLSYPTFGMLVPPSFTMTALASDSDGTIAKVDFYKMQGPPTLVGTDTTAPYTCNISGLTPGSYVILYAIAYDNNNNTASTPPFSFFVVSEQAPTVTLNSPTNNSTYVPGTPIILSATASDDGTVSKVEFYDGTTKIGEDLTSPYTYTWTNPSGGSHVLKARAIDNAGIAGDSPSVNVAVINHAPTCSLTSPLTGTTIPYPVTLSATAADVDGNLARVEFYDGVSTKVGEDTSSPYSISIIPSVGPHYYFARAIDTAGAFTNSATASVMVVAPSNPPTVSISSPSAGAIFYPGSNITLSATASDSDGSISKVEFFQGTTKLGEDTSSPYNFTWNNVAGGNYTISAKATDNTGMVATSSGVAISVANRPPTANISSPADGAIVPPTFTASATASDPDGTIARVQFWGSTGYPVFEQALLGEDTTAPYELTISNLSETMFRPNGYIYATAIDNDNASGTGAFRVISRGYSNPPTVSITAPANGDSVAAPGNTTITADATDSDGTISKVEFFAGGTRLGEDTSLPYSWYWNTATEGTHNLTAKATDDSGTTVTSNTVTVTVTNIEPTVTITEPADWMTVTYPFTITADANDLDGEISRVVFDDSYDFFSPIGEDTTAPYTLTVDMVTPGSYTYYARAYDNGGKYSTIPVSVHVTVVAPSQAPTVEITSPTPNAHFHPGDTITINATAADSDGTVSKVAFFRGTTLLGEDTSSPYSFTWTNVPAGSYSLTAVATDNTNVSKTSAAVAITVSNYSPMVEITSPTFGETKVYPFTVTATASDSDGYVTKVVFWNGPYHKLGEVSTAPYTIEVTNLPYNGTINALAYDNEGGTGSSFVVVNGITSLPPTVTLLNPTSGASYVAPATIMLAAEASDPDGTIAKVEFYRGTTFIGEDTTAPYELAWNGVGTGTYSITAKAIDNMGVTATTAAASVTVTNSLPTVTLTNPAAGRIPCPFTIEATASDTDGSITRVECWASGQSLGQDSTAPYTCDVTGLNVGMTYQLCATAFDNGGAAVTTPFTSVTITHSQPPTVTLTTPQSGSQYLTPASILLTADAEDPDGSIARVEFYDGSTLIGTVTTAPYSMTYTTSTTGTHALKAVAIDNATDVTTSSVVSVEVFTTYPPTVTIDTPTANSSVLSPVTITADAADADGTVTSVKFYKASIMPEYIPPTLLGESTTAPYTYTGPLASGTHTVFAVATDNAGVEGRSMDRVFTVTQAPTATITDVRNAPPAVRNYPNNEKFEVGQSIQITASVTSMGPTVTKVEFYYDYVGNSSPQYIDTDTTSPYSCIWSNVPEGNIALTTKVYASMVIDGQCIELTSWSASRNINILPDLTLDGTVQFKTVGGNWNDLSSAYMNMTTDWGLPIEFRVYDAITGNLVFNHVDFDNTGVLREDTVSYIWDFGDGTPIVNASVPPLGAAVSHTYAQPGQYFGSLTVHDDAGPSFTDDTDIIVPIYINVIDVPIIQITSPANNATFPSGISIPIRATASQRPGAIARVYFQYDTIPSSGSWTTIGSDVPSSGSDQDFAFTWGSVPHGHYNLRAYVEYVDPLIPASNPSPHVAIHVNSPPAVSMVTVSGEYLEGVDIPLQAWAIDPDCPMPGINRVEFYRNDQLFYTADYSIVNPYVCDTWIDAQLGTYTIYAKAYDACGAMAKSASITLTVKQEVNPPLEGRVEYKRNAGSTWTIIGDGYSYNMGISGMVHETLDFRAINTAGNLVGSVDNDPAGVSDIARYQWDFGDGTLSPILTPSPAGTDPLGVPFSHVYTQPGMYLAALRVFDDATATGTLNDHDFVRYFTVQISYPTIRVTVPANGALFAPSSNVPIQARVTPSDVQFNCVRFSHNEYEDLADVPYNSSGLYNTNWAPATKGQHTFVARILDESFEVVTSAQVTITVNSPPSVSITYPRNNDSFEAGTSITITADAADLLDAPLGTIKRVKFFVNGNLLNTDDCAPFTCTWANVSQGTYTLTAEAVDDDDLSTTSAPIVVKFINCPENALQAQVEYRFPAGTGEWNPLSQYSSYGSINLPLDATAEFRAVDSRIPGPVNGIDYDGLTPKTTNVATYEWYFGQGSAIVMETPPSPNGVPISQQFTQPGMFLAKLRIYDDNVGTDDPDFVLPFMVTVFYPTISITQPTEGAWYTSGSNVTITGNITPVDAPINSVTIYNYETPIATGVPVTAGNQFSWTWSNIPQGHHSLTAICFGDVNYGTDITSSPVHISATHRPTVHITTPVTGMEMDAGKDLLIEVDAHDEDGIVTKIVLYYTNASGVAKVLTTLYNPPVPYQYTWNNVPVGTYTLHAFSYDNDGAQSNMSNMVTFEAKSFPTGIPAKMQYNINGMGWQDFQSIGIPGNPFGGVIRLDVSTDNVQFRLVNPDTGIPIPGTDPDETVLGTSVDTLECTWDFGNGSALDQSSTLPGFVSRSQSYSYGGTYNASVHCRDLAPNADYYNDDPDFNGFFRVQVYDCQVKITKPDDGQQYAPGDDVIIKAMVYDSRILEDMSSPLTGYTMHFTATNLVAPYNVITIGIDTVAELDPTRKNSFIFVKSWEDVPEGHYELKAFITINGMTYHSRTLPPVRVRITPLPIVVIDSVTSDPVGFPTGCDITISGRAWDTSGYPEDYIGRVAIYQDGRHGTYLADASYDEATHNWSYTWTDVPQGDYWFLAKGFDNDDAVGMSELWHVTVGTPPILTMTMPTVEAKYGENIDPITIAAQLTSTNWPISRVDFMISNTAIANNVVVSAASVTELPELPLTAHTVQATSFTNCFLPAGYYRVLAKAYDGNDVVAISEAVDFTVELVPPDEPLQGWVLYQLPGQEYKVLPNEYFVIDAFDIAPFNVAVQNPKAEDWDTDTATRTQHVDTVRYFFNRDASDVTKEVEVTSATDYTTLLDYAAEGPGLYTAYLRYDDNGICTCHSPGVACTDDVPAPGKQIYFQVNVRAGEGVRPTVTVITPATGTFYEPYAQINIAAAVSDSPMVVEEVTFYHRAVGDVSWTEIATDPTVPYTTLWANVGTGDYELMARAWWNTRADYQDSVVPYTKVHVYTKPTVFFTNPHQDAVFESGANITVLLSAWDRDGSDVEYIELFQNGTLLTTIHNPLESGEHRYGYNWLNVPPGTYTLTARAVDNEHQDNWAAPVTITVSSERLVGSGEFKCAGDTNWSTLQNFIVAVDAVIEFRIVDETNQYAPLTDPSDRDIFNDTEFFTDVTTFTWNFPTPSVPAIFPPVDPTVGSVVTHSYSMEGDYGAYLAIDDSGVIVDDPARNVQFFVTAKLPVLTISSPVEGAKVPPNDFVHIVVDVTPNNGTVETVNIWYTCEGGMPTLLTTLTGSSFVYDWNNIPAGHYQLWAEATTVAGRVLAPSTIVNYVVQEIPQVNIVYPTNSATFDTYQTIPLIAVTPQHDQNCTMNGCPHDEYWHALATSDIVAVTVYKNGELLGNGTKHPEGTITLLGNTFTVPEHWRFDWADMPQGAYNISAIARNADDFTSVPCPLTVYVNHNSANQLTGTVQYRRPHEDWQDIPTPLVNTVEIDRGTNVDFRLVRNGQPIVTENDIDLINGQEVIDQVICTWNLDGTSVDVPLTLLPPDHITNPGFETSKLFGTAPVMYMANCSLHDVAAEQYNSVPLTSPYVIPVPGIIDDPDLNCQFTVRVTEWPWVQITTPADDSSYRSWSYITVTAVASQRLPVERVKFYANGVFIGEDLTPDPYATYTINWGPVPSGTYDVTAEAIYTTLDPAQTSAPVQVIVHDPPMVSIVNPVDGAMFGVGWDMTIEAQATDHESMPVQQVEFSRRVVGSEVWTPIATDTSYEYIVTWPNIPVGTYEITARAVDNDGFDAWATPVTVVITHDLDDRNGYELNSKALEAWVACQVPYDTQTPETWEVLPVITDDADPLTTTDYAKLPSIRVVQGQQVGFRAVDPTFGFAFAPNANDYDVVDYQTSIDTIQYEWEIVGQFAPVTSTNFPGAQITYAFNTPGRYRGHLRVRDLNGNAGTPGYYNDPDLDIEFEIIVKPTDPPTAGTPFRVVAEWDADADLDLHVFHIPDGGSAMQHVAYPVGSMSMFNGVTKIGELDYDKIGTLGPEIFTALAVDPGTYYVAVNFYGQPGVQQPVDAMVTVDTPLGPVTAGPYTLTAANKNDSAAYPLFGSTDYWWRVCDIEVDTLGNVTVNLPNTTVPLNQ